MAANNGATEPRQHTDTEHSYRKMYSPNSLGMLIASISGVIALWLLCWFVVANSLDSWTERGQFGDMFGAVNALFSGLAFAAVIVTLILQRRDLSVQIEMLVKTVHEMELSSDAQQEAAQALRRQLAIQNRASQLHAMSSLLEEYRALHHEYEGKDIEEMEREESGLSFFQHRERMRHRLEEMLHEFIEDTIDDDDEGGPE